MALTKVSRGLLSTGIVDNSNATAITLNADESATFAGNVGIGAARTDGTLHVHTGTAGTVAASTQADDIVIENSAEGGMTIITPDDQSARIRFTSPSTNNEVGGAFLFYRQNINKMQIGTAVSGGVLSLASGAGSEAISIDASQRVGIKTAPDAWKSTWSALDIGVSGSLFAQDNNTTGLANNLFFNGSNWVHKNTGATALYQQSEGLHLFYSNASQAAGATFSPTEVMRIDGATGNITQTGANSATLTVKAPTDNASLTLQAGASDSGAEAAIINFLQNTTYKWQMGMDTNNGFRWYNYAASSEAMRIDTASNLLLGTPSAISLGKLSVLFDGTNQNSYIAKTTRSLNGSSFGAYLNSSGTVIGSISQNSSSTVLYNQSSDQRLKENIADSDDSGNVIDAIQVRKFDWIAGGEHEKYGFIAQELKTVVPNAVAGMGLPDEEDPMLGVDPSKLMALAIKEIQMLRTRVAELENN